MARSFIDVIVCAIAGAMLSFIALLGWIVAVLLWYPCLDCTRQGGPYEEAAGIVGLIWLIMCLAGCLVLARAINRKLQSPRRLTLGSALVGFAPLGALALLGSLDSMFGLRGF
jgi:hypothetical protein